MTTDTPTLDKAIGFAKVLGNWAACRLIRIKYGIPRFIRWHGEDIAARFHYLCRVGFYMSTIAYVIHNW
jgi:hypothetical protein